MQTRFANRVRSALLTCGLISLMQVRTAAQTPAELGLQTYAGLTITGAVGTVYSIESTTNLPPTTRWRFVTLLLLPASPYVWVDTSAPATGQRYYRAVAENYTVPANMIYLPPGAFTMGSPTNEVDRQTGEGPQTTVTLREGFWIGKHEVTQAEYEALTGLNPSYFRGDPSRPVDSVSWFEATDYCVRLTRQEQAAGRIATNSVYRLPTEAEWEYACRSGTSTRFSYGEDAGYTQLANYAWHAGNSGQATHSVGQKLPNPWGLFDLHGNLWEWCQDWWDAYVGGNAIDPQGPATGSERVIRGGGWLYQARFCRSAQRNALSPDRSGSGVGFRVVLDPGQGRAGR